MQEAFLSMFRGLSSFRGDSAFSSWVYRVASNAALMRLRKERRYPTVSLDALLPKFSE